MLCVVVNMSRAGKPLKKHQGSVYNRPAVVGTVPLQKAIDSKLSLKLNWFYLKWQ